MIVDLKTRRVTVDGIEWVDLLPPKKITALIAECREKLYDLVSRKPINEVVVYDGLEATFTDPSSLDQAEGDYDSLKLEENERLRKMLASDPEAD